MTDQDIIQKILAKNPELSEEKILEELLQERMRTGGLLGDETLLRLIAARYGVEVQQNIVYSSGTLPTSRLFAGLNDVTVAGRLIAVYPVKTFEGEKPGKIAALVLVDNCGTLRVVLWNDKAVLIESGELKVGQAVRLLHGYTREDRYGRVELHLGGKSKIEVEPQEKASEYPATEKFTTKIGSLTGASGAVHLSGVVKDVSGLSSFIRSDDTDGKVMRFTLADDSGQVAAVIWNEKVTELEKKVKVNSHLLLVNVRVKEAQNGDIEVHVDSNTYVNVQTAELQLTKIANLSENQTANVQGIVASVPQSKEVTTGKGEKVKLTIFDLKDDSGIVQISAWRQHADAFDSLKIGDTLLLENALARKGFRDKKELSTRSGTVASINPP
ncbi:MAG TPA: OB-fold nucleic acid binding domain-containing protein [Candidatus Limnocylindrales bacterium]|nr:OB-fold nucleic acid binding domain-containing protein [Candidatus Limnocylindrales bacterium]